MYILSTAYLLPFFNCCIELNNDSIFVVFVHNLNICFCCGHCFYNKHHQIHTCVFHMGVCVLFWQLNIYFNFMAIGTSFDSYLTDSCVPFARLPVQFLLPYYISSSWLPSPGCSWRECSSISCWWRFLRVNIHEGNTSTWSAMGCLPSLWLCQLL